MKSGHASRPAPRAPASEPTASGSESAPRLEDEPERGPERGPESSLERPIGRGQLDAPRSARGSERSDAKVSAEPCPAAESAPAERGAAATNFIVPRTVALTGLFCFALLYTAYFARSFLLPVVLALLLQALLRPVVRWLKVRLRVPEALGAAIVVLGLVLAGGYGVYRLALPASEWVASAPETLRKLEHELRTLRKPVEDVSKAAESAADTVKELTSVGGEEPPQQVEIRERSLTDLAIGKTTALVTQTAMSLVLLYFLLASGDLFLRRLVHVLPRLRDKKRAVEIARSISSDISVYLGTVTLINVGFGFCVGLAMHLLDMPHPVLWGVVAFVTNYVPYLGGIFSAASIGLVAFQHFPSTSGALLPPLAYVVLNTIESEIATPLILGRRLFLNPVVIFTGLMFWAWIWGIPGALLAVPMLVVVKILCDHVPPLAPLGEFLERAHRPNAPDVPNAAHAPGGNGSRKGELPEARAVRS